MKTEGLESLLFTSCAPVRYATENKFPEASLMFNGDAKLRDSTVRRLYDLEALNVSPSGRGWEINLAEAITGVEPNHLNGAYTAIQVYHVPEWAIGHVDFIRGGSYPWRPMADLLETVPLDADPEVIRDRVSVQRLEAITLNRPSTRVIGRGANQFWKLVSEGVDAISEGDTNDRARVWNEARSLRAVTSVDERVQLMDILCHAVSPTRADHRTELSFYQVAELNQTFLGREREEQQQVEIAFMNKALVDPAGGRP